MDRYGPVWSAMERYGALWSPAELCGALVGSPPVTGQDPATDIDGDAKEAHQQVSQSQPGRVDGLNA